LNRWTLIVVERLLAASRDGNFDALLAVLDPNVVVRADRAALPVGASPRGPLDAAHTARPRSRAA